MSIYSSKKTTLPSSLMVTENIEVYREANKALINDTAIEKVENIDQAVQKIEKKWVKYVMADLVCHEKQNEKIKNQLLNINHKIVEKICNSSLQNPNNKTLKQAKIYLENHQICFGGFYLASICIKHSMPYVIFYCGNEDENKEISQVIKAMNYIFPGMQYRCHFYDTDPPPHDAISWRSQVHWKMGSRMDIIKDNKGSNFLKEIGL